MRLFKIIYLMISFIKSSSCTIGRREILVGTTSNYLNTLYKNENKDDVKSEIDLSNNPLTIHYYSPVSTDSCMKLTQILQNMDKQSKQLEIDLNFRPPIKLHMQSLGGELLPAFFVCDLIQNLDTDVHIYIDGYVASAASLIAICGDKRYMTLHSTMLIHQIKSSSAGKFNEMKDEMDNLNFFMNNLREIYLTNTNIDEIELNKLLETDIWLPSKKCIDLGFVDEII